MSEIGRLRPTVPRPPVAPPVPRPSERVPDTPLVPREEQPRITVDTSTIPVPDSRVPAQPAQPTRVELGNEPLPSQAAQQAEKAAAKVRAAEAAASVAVSEAAKDTNGSSGADTTPSKKLPLLDRPGKLTPDKPSGAIGQPPTVEGKGKAPTKDPVKSSDKAQGPKAGGNTRTADTPGKPEEKNRLAVITDPDARAGKPQDKTEKDTTGKPAAGAAAPAQRDTPTEQKATEKPNTPAAVKKPEPDKKAETPAADSHAPQPQTVSTEERTKKSATTETKPNTPPDSSTPPAVTDPAKAPGQAVGAPEPKKGTGKPHDAPVLQQGTESNGQAPSTSESREKNGESPDQTREGDGNPAATTEQPADPRAAQLAKLREQLAADPNNKELQQKITSLENRVEAVTADGQVIEGTLQGSTPKTDQSPRPETENNKREEKTYTTGEKRYGDAIEAQIDKILMEGLGVDGHELSQLESDNDPEHGMGPKIAAARKALRERIENFNKKGQNASTEPGDDSPRPGPDERAGAAGEARASASSRANKNTYNPDPPDPYARLYEDLKNWAYENLRFRREEYPFDTPKSNDSPEDPKTQTPTPPRESESSDQQRAAIEQAAIDAFIAGYRQEAQQVIREYINKLPSDSPIRADFVARGWRALVEEAYREATERQQGPQGRNERPYGPSASPDTPEAPKTQPPHASNEPQFRYERGSPEDPYDYARPSKAERRVAVAGVIGQAGKTVGRFLGNLGRNNPVGRFLTNENDVAFVSKGKYKVKIGKGQVVEVNAPNASVARLKAYWKTPINQRRQR